MSKSSSEKVPQTAWDTTIQGNFLSSLGWMLWVAFGFVFSSALVSSFLLALQAVGVLNVNNSGTTVSFAIDLSVYMFLAIVVLWLPYHLWRRTKNPKPTSKLTKKFILKLIGADRWPKWADVKCYFVHLPVYYVTIIVVSMIALLLVGNDTMNQYQNVGYSDGVSGFMSLCFIFIALVIIAPLFEEVIMRGFLYGKLRGLMPKWLAAVATSALFALAHGQINVGIMTFVLSMFLCTMREKTGAIWAGLLLHMTVNLIAYSIRFLGAGS